MRVIAIWCRHDKTNIISIDGQIPWFSKKDLTFFRRVSSLGLCVMGKNTYSDIMTRNPQFFKTRMFEVLSSKNQLHSKTGYKNIIVCGGKAVYEKYMSEKIPDIVYDCVFKGDIKMGLQSNEISACIDVLNKHYKFIKTIKIDDSVECRKFEKL